LCKLTVKATIALRKYSAALRRKKATINAGGNYPPACGGVG